MNFTAKNAVANVKIGLPKTRALLSNYKDKVIYAKGTSGVELRPYEALICEL
ncbi:MAG: hypothetical protein ACXVJN_23560 [Mucilaginibacter sp.]